MNGTHDYRMPLRNQDLPHFLMKTIEIDQTQKRSDLVGSIRKNITPMVYGLRVRAPELDSAPRHFGLLREGA